MTTQKLSEILSGRCTKCKNSRRFFGICAYSKKGGVYLSLVAVDWWQFNYWLRRPSTNNNNTNEVDRNIYVITRSYMFLVHDSWLSTLKVFLIIIFRKHSFLSWAHKISVIIMIISLYKTCGTCLSQAIKLFSLAVFCWRLTLSKLSKFTQRDFNTFLLYRYCKP